MVSAGLGQRDPRELLGNAGCLRLCDGELQSPDAAGERAGGDRDEVAIPVHGRDAGLRRPQRRIRGRAAQGLPGERDQRFAGLDHPVVLRLAGRRGDLPSAAAPALVGGQALDPAVPLAAGGADTLAGRKIPRRFESLGDRKPGDHAAGFHGLHARGAGRFPGIKAALLPSRLVAVVHRPGSCVPCGNE